MSVRGRKREGGRPGLAALIRSDFERQAEMFGRMRVPVSEGFWLSVDYRIRHAIDGLPPGPGRILLQVVQYPFHKIVKVVTRSGIGAGTTIGPGLLLAHFCGVWIHPDVVIGADCRIFHQVTIAGRGRDAQAGMPRIGDGVTIRPGARVLGPVTVGDRAEIGVNAVVIEDVPPGAVVAGNPARIIRTADQDRAGAADGRG